jgi:hypothetical protein
MLLPPSFGDVLHFSVPDTATFVAPLDGFGEDGVVGFAANKSTTGSKLKRTANSENE